MLHVNLHQLYEHVQHNIFLQAPGGIYNACVFSRGKTDIFQVPQDPRMRQYCRPCLFVRHGVTIFLMEYIFILKENWSKNHDKLI